ncbi:hypothetical protein PybrP1_008193 [[Pythium] brassicae (nom. inval.)]|nr:hypothetical protein PybrP1_008193 [[Pythium] brassicae (nom. inval.)]
MRIHDGLREDVEEHVVVLGHEPGLDGRRAHRELERVECLDERALRARVHVVLRARAGVVRPVNLAHDRAHKQALEAVGHEVRVRLLRLRQVHVHVLVVGRERRHVVVAQPAQLELVRERGLDVAHDLVLTVAEPMRERVDPRVEEHVGRVSCKGRSGRYARHLGPHGERHAADVVAQQHVFDRLEKRLGRREQRALLGLLVQQDDVKHVHARLLGRRQRLLRGREERDDVRERRLHGRQVEAAAGLALAAVVRGRGRRGRLAVGPRGREVREAAVAREQAREVVVALGGRESNREHVVHGRPERERLGKEAVVVVRRHRVDHVRPIDAADVELERALAHGDLGMVEQRDEQVEERLRLVEQGRERGRVLGRLAPGDDLAHDGLDLREALAVGRHLAVHEQLPRLERHERVLVLLEVGEALEQRQERRGLERLAPRRRRQVAEQLQQHAVLRLERAVRARDAEHDAEVARVLLAQREHRVLDVVHARVHELDREVPVQQLGDRGLEARAQPALVLVRDVPQRRHGGFKVRGRAVRRERLLVRVEHGRDGGAAERRGATAEALDLLRELREDVERDAASERRQRLLELLDRQQRAAERLEELGHRRVDEVLRHKVAVQHGLEDTHGALELVQHAGAARAARRGRALGRELADKALGLLDARRVVELHGRDAVARREHGTLGLEQPDDAGLGREQRHVHLHDLDLGERQTLAQARAVVHEVPRELARRVGHEPRRVVLVREHARGAVDDEPQALRLLCRVRDVRLAVQQHEEAAVRERADLGLRVRGVEEERKVDRAAAARAHRVLDALVDELERLGLREQLARRELPALELADVLDEAACGRLVGRADSADEHDEQRVRAALEPYLRVARDALVEPRRVDAVVLEVVRLHHVDNVLDSGVDVAPDRQLLERQDHVLARAVAGRAPREEVPDLRVRELVDLPGRVDREVAPDVGRAPEVELLERAARGLEARVRVLGRDARCDHVAVRRRLLRALKVDRRGPERVL